MIRARLYVGSAPLASPSCDDIDGEALMDRVAGALIAAGVQGATLTPAVGLWEGVKEGSIVVEILSEPDAALAWPAPVAALAEQLRAALAQDAVLWTLEHDVASGMARRA